MFLFKGWFGIPESLFFSVPVRFTAPKTYKVVEDFQLNEHVLRKMRKVIQVSIGYQPLIIIQVSV